MRTFLNRSWIPALMTFLLGCASGEPKQVSPAAVPVYRADPYAHSFYVGSDEQYHYFVWDRLLRGGQLKVDRAELTLSREFKRGAGRAFIRRSPDGKVQVYDMTGSAPAPGTGNPTILPGADS